MTVTKKMGKRLVLFERIEVMGKFKFCVDFCTVVAGRAPQDSVLRGPDNIKRTVEGSLPNGGETSSLKIGDFTKTLPVCTILCI